MPVFIVGDITVPDVTNLSLADAIEALEDVDLDYNPTYAYTGDPATILSQDPIGGTEVTGPFTVELTVSGIFPITQLSSRIRRVIHDIDVTRPNTPTGFNAQSNSDTQLLLGWNAATDPQGGASEANTGVVGYKIYRNGSLRTTTSSLTFLDTGLTSYTVYTYQISSYDGAGNESFLSASIAPRTLDLTAPTAPTVTATATGTTTISVALTAPSTDAGSGV